MSHFNLRHKLTAIFVLLAAVGGLCGAVGLYYVDRVSDTVDVFTETTSPTLATMTELIRSSLHFKTVVFHGVDAGKSARDLATSRTALHGTTHRTLSRLRLQIQAAGVAIDIDEAERLETAFAAALDRMIDAHRREQSALAGLTRTETALTTTLANADRQLEDLIRSSEADIVVAEERTRIAVQLGTATVAELGGEVSHLFNDTYQILKLSRRLSGVFDEIEGAANLLRNGATPRWIDALEKRLAEHARGAQNILDLLAARLEAPGPDQRLTALQADLARLGPYIDGAHGLIALKREAMAAQHALRTGRNDVLTVEHAYFALLETVKRAVADLNAAAKATVAESIAEARIAFGACLVLALAVAVLLANFMARRITRPLAKLTRHVVRVGDCGSPSPLRDAGVTGLQDEIGTLARAFNATLDELGEARRLLIAESRQEVRVQYERLNAAVSNMAHGLTMFDRDQRLVVSNARWAEIYDVPWEMRRPGTSFQDIVKIFLERCDPQSLPRLTEVAKYADQHFHQTHFGVYQLKKGRTVAITGQPIPDGGNVVIHEDITERRRTEQRITHMAMHDMLTNLPNRVNFREALTAALGRVARGAEIAVLFFDLDHFKNVNDSLGHPIGDALLRAVAARLKACVRDTDTIARLGGDEFAIVQNDINQPRGAAELAARLVAELGRPYEIDGRTVVIGASVGIALAPADGGDPDTLLRNADMALYRSKEVGRGTFSFFKPEMDAQMQERRTLETDLRRALAEGQFVIHYQPLVSASSGRIGCLEALVRWPHPKRGFIAPATFIPLAEETGLIVELGAWVLREACSAAAGWPDAVRVAVNLSPAQFVGGRVLEDVLAALASSGLDPDRLELEITEAILSKNTDAKVAMLERLHDLGVRIAMDDFGSGHSSLGYLRRFAFDKIKIDPSFVRDLGASADAVAIVRAVNGLAAALGIETVAEGIETGEQLAGARREGCSEIQGDLLGAPVPLAEVTGLLSRAFGLRGPDAAPSVRNAA